MLDWTAIAIGVVSSMLTTVAMGLAFIYFIINRSDEMRRELTEKIDNKSHELNSKIDSESKDIYEHIEKFRGAVGQETHSLRKQITEVRAEYVSHNELNPILNDFKDALKDLRKDIRDLVGAIGKD